MLDTSARLLQTLTLLQSRRDWAAADLAERLEITERTVRRDIDRLRQLGYRVDSAPGTGGGYRLGSGTGVPPLLLNEDEAVAIAVALRGAMVTGIDGIQESAVEALVKLEHALPADVRRRVEVLYAAVVPLGGPQPTVDADVLLTVATAIRDSERIRVDYITHAGTRLDRRLEPHRIINAENRWYLVAWDIDQDDWRTFRLDRLESPTPTGRRFEPRSAPDPDIAAYTARGITLRPYRYQCRVIVDAPASEVTAVAGTLSSRVRPLDADSCEVTGGGDSLEQMAIWISRLGAEVEVIEPIEVLPHLDALAARLGRASLGSHDSAQASAAPRAPL